MSKDRKIKTSKDRKKFNKNQNLLFALQTF